MTLGFTQEVNENKNELNNLYILYNFIIIHFYFYINPKD